MALPKVKNVFLEQLLDSCAMNSVARKEESFVNCTLVEEIVQYPFNSFLNKYK